MTDRTDEHRTDDVALPDDEPRAVEELDDEDDGWGQMLFSVGLVALVALLFLACYWMGWFTPFS